MRARPGIASLLISLFALNAVLCPCAALTADAAPEASESVEMAHAGHHMSEPNGSGSSGHPVDASDCHTDIPDTDCGMADIRDVEVTGKPSDWQLDSVTLYAPVTLPLAASGVRSVGLRFSRQPPPGPPSSPIANRDRLLI